MIRKQIKEYSEYGNKYTVYIEWSWNKYNILPIEKDGCSLYAGEMLSTMQLRSMISKLEDIERHIWGKLEDEVDNKVLEEFNCTARV